MAFQPIIYTFGGSEYLNSIMESLSILFDFSKRNSLLTLYRFAGVLGVFILALRPFAARGPDGSPGSLDWPWFLRFALIILVVIVPKTDVRIEDITLKKTYVVTNAPWALSIFGWMTSSIGYGLTEMYENSLGGGMNPVESYSGNGIAFGSQYYNVLPSISRFQTRSMDNFVRPFINECMVPAVTPINERISGLSKEEFLHSPNYASALSGMNASWLKNRYVDTPKGPFTCFDMRQMIMTQWGPDSALLLSKMGISETTVDELDKSYIKQATDSSASSLRQAMMINAIYSSVAAQGVQYGDTALADSLYQTQAQYQQITAWRQGSQFAASSLVWLHIVVEGMIYAIWPLLTFLMLLPSGWVVIMQYIKILFWIQMWPILYAILNSIIAVYATSRSAALAMQYGGFTMSDVFQIGDLNGGIVSTAGYISTMVPIISWMLIQQGGGLIEAVRSHIGSTNSVAQKTGAQEADGSLTLNKVTVEDSNTAGNSISGMATHKQIGSTGTATTVGGNTTIQSSAMDNKLVTGINYKQTASNALEQLDSQIQSNAANLSKQWQKAAQSTYNATNGTNSNHGHNVDEGYGNDEKFNKLVQVVAENFAKASVGVSGGAFGVKAGAEVGTSIGANGINKLSQDLGQLQKYMDQNGYGDQHGTSSAFNSVKGLIQQSGELVSLISQHSNAQKIATSTGVDITTSGDNAVLQSLYSQGYTPQQLNDMQFNDIGQFRELMQEEGNKFVRGTLGDNKNYSPQELDSSFKAKQTKLANTHQNDGNIDHETATATQDYDKTMHNNEKTYQEIERQYHTGKDPDLVLTDSPTASAGKTTVKSISNAIGNSNPISKVQDRAVKKAQQGKVKPYNSQK